MKKRDQISKRLAEIGASFEGGTDRYFCQDLQCRCQNSPRPMYHVRPGYGNSGDTKAFANLDEIDEYISLLKRIEGMDEISATAEVQDFWDSLDW